MLDFLRRLFSRGLSGSDGQDDPAVNPRRTRDLYRLTEEGYIIAQDIACQYEYAQQHMPCPRCGSQMKVMAQINRASQGINELVCSCTTCGQRTSLLFDVSNAVYQAWIARQLGDLYIRNYDGPPRTPARH
jgi:transcription elongation factor Elf1